MGLNGLRIDGREGTTTHLQILITVRSKVDKDNTNTTLQRYHNLEITRTVVMAFSLYGKGLTEIDRY